MNTGSKVQTTKVYIYIYINIYIDRGVGGTEGYII